MTFPDRAALADERDLVARLRWPPISGPDDHPISVKLRIEAADEIERLRRSPSPYSGAAGEAVAWQRRLDGGSWHECTAEQAKYASEFGHPENFPTLAAEIRALSPSPTSVMPDEGKQK